MKRCYLILCLLLLSVGSFAKKGPILLYGPADYRLTGLSPNGKWACGVINDGTVLNQAFVWDLTADEITLLSDGSNESFAYGVSDNGIVVGAFPDTEVTVNKAPVITAGYWKEGKWHHLETLEEKAGSGFITHPDFGGQALCISQNGEYIGGALYENKTYIPLVWKDGKIVQRFGNDMGGAINGVSNDGKMATGWTYTKISENTRVSVLWRAGKEAVYLCDEAKGAPFRGGKQFSPNEKYILYEEGIYDITTGKSTVIPQYGKGQLWSYSFNAMTDNKTVMGNESIGEFGADAYSIIYKDGETRRLDEYLTSIGVDFAKDGIVRPNPDAAGSYYLETAVGISEDEKTYAMMFYSTGEEVSDYRPMIIKLDEDVTTREPVALKGEQMDGISVIKLRWNAPLANQEAVKGYNLYRNGTKINKERLTTPSFVDASPDKATYQYTVTAVYADTESKQSEPVTVTITDKKLSAPYNLTARQKGINSAYLQWNAPTSNLINKKYFNPEEEIVGFGGGNISFASAIRFDKEEMSYYEGYKIKKVAFYPMTKQDKWKVLIYKDKTLLYEEDITSKVKDYGYENIITLNKAVDIPKEEDVYVAIEVTVPSTTDTNNVIGHDYINCVPGYSDLVHQVSEEWFYSLYEEGQEAGVTFAISWAISMLISPADATDNSDIVKEYAIYADNEQVGTTKENKYLQANQKDGEHVYGIAAVYADGKVSDRVSAGLSVKEAYKAIEKVDIKSDGVRIKASWEAPADDDETLITYSSETPAKGVKGPEKNNYGYSAKAIYTRNMLHTFNNYQVKAFRFYPMADAVFTIMIYKNGLQIYEQEVEEYTVGQWNTIALDEPFAIEDGMEYSLVLDCFDVAPDATPMGVDNQVPYIGESDAYSTNGGEYFSSLFGAASISGNWLMGLIVTSPEAGKLPIDGYHVRIDGEQKNENIVTDTHYEYDFGTADSKKHRINVDVVYTAVGKKEGSGVFFTLDATGIEDNQIAVIRVFPNPATNYVRVEGGNATSITAYTTAGQQVAHSDENTLNVSGLDAGMYILKIRIDGRDKTTKLNVIR